MRGLPPLPVDVARIIATWDVNGDLCTTSWTIFAPGSSSATYDQLNTLLGDFFFSPIADALEVIGSDVTLVELLCVTTGPSGLTATLTPAPNAGALDSTSALNSALVWTFRTADRGRSSHMHVWLPLARENIGGDRRRLSPLGFVEAAARAQDFLGHVNELPSPDGGLCVLVAVHRQHAGVPLPSATFSPVESAWASPVIGTQRKRTRSAPRAPSPL